jgi:hypothetical protein
LRRLLPVVSQVPSGHDSFEDAASALRELKGSGFAFPMLRTTLDGPRPVEVAYVEPLLAVLEQMPKVRQRLERVLSGRFGELVEGSDYDRTS